MAEQKIAQAEGQALAEVRIAAVDLAVDAAEAVIEKKLSGTTGGDIFKSDLSELKAHMN